MTDQAEPSERARRLGDAMREAMRYIDIDNYDPGEWHALAEEILEIFKALEGCADSPDDQEASDERYVYVLSSEPYHDNSTLMGAYESLEAAMLAVDRSGLWREGSAQEENAFWFQDSGRSHDNSYFITCLPLHASEPPQQQEYGEDQEHAEEHPDDAPIDDDRLGDHPAGS